MPFSIIPFLLLFVPILEITAFILIGGQIGIFPTLGMILVTAIIGSILLRIQGFSTLARIQSETQAGKLPGKSLVHGVMIMIAGVLLLTPGFVTDTIGFLLFVPFIRTAIWSWIGTKITMTTFSGASVHPGGNFRPEQGNLDPDIVDLDDDEYAETASKETPWNRRIDADRKGN